MPNVTVAGKPKLVLHIGSHKTGTTSIQGDLAANRTWLEGRGIAYPDPAPYFRFHRIDGHHDLAHALASSKPRHVRRAERFRQHLVDLGSRFDRIVLSAEPFYRHVLSRPGAEPATRTLAGFIEGHRAFVAKTAEYFSPFDVEILLFLRRPDRFVESLYKNAVVTSLYAEGFAAYTRKPEFRFSYTDHLELLGEHFPKITLKSYEGSLAAGIVQTFFEAIGAGPPPTVGSDHLRRSVSNKAALWIERSKREERLNKRKTRTLWHFALLPVARPLFGSDRTSSLWRSAQRRDEFTTRHMGALPTDFFPPAEPQIAAEATWTDTEHEAATRAFRDWKRHNAVYLMSRALRRVPPYQIEATTPLPGSRS